MAEYWDDLAGAAAGVSDAIGSLANSIGEYKAVQDTNETNAAIAQANNEWNAEQSLLQYQRQIELWNMTNNYNTPAAQVQRLIEAGLSPYLAYSNAAAGGTASSMQAPNAVRAEPYSYMSPLKAFATLVPFFQNLKKNDLLNQNLALKNQSEALQNLERTTTLDYLKDFLAGRNAGQWSNRYLTDSRWRYQLMQNANYENYGSAEAKARMEILRNRVAAWTQEKELLSTKVMLSNIEKDLLQMKKDYWTEYDYEGRKDWLRMFKQISANVLSKFNPFSWFAR